MKLMKMRNFYKILGFIAGLAVIFVVASYISKPKNEEIYDSVSLQLKLTQLREEKEQSIDVLFAGDSEAYAAFCPYVFYGKSGFTSYVMGVSSQRVCDTYAGLAAAFKTQSPKVVVVETNNLMEFGGPIKESDDYVMATAQKAVPLFKFHSRWKTFFIQRMNGSNDFAAEKIQKGFRYRDNESSFIGSLDYMIETDKVHPFGGESEKYLDKIVELCDKNGAKLVLVSAPSIVCWNYEKHNAITAYVKKVEERSGKKLEYIDMNLMNDVIGIDWRKDTKDKGNHVNFEGAVKTSKVLSDILAKKYNLPNHKKDPEYAEWETNGRDFFKNVKNTQYVEDYYA